MGVIITSLPKYQNRRGNYQHESGDMIPFDLFAQVPDRESGEYHQRNDFLDAL